MANKKLTKKEELALKQIKQKAGLAVIIICMIVLVFTLGGFFIKFSDLSSSSSDENLSSKDLKAEITNIEDIDTDGLFASKYYETLNVLATTVAHGTTWLEICPESQEIIGDKVFIKTCNEKYNSIDDLKKYLNKYITKEYAEELIGDSYLDKDGSLYITPVIEEINKDYIENASYSVKSVTTNRIIYMVKSKYGKLGCENNCNYTYKEHKFILEYIDGEWLVSNMEMPY